jgi:thiol-disulfide isomerase/thioredoxin
VLAGLLGHGVLGMLAQGSAWVWLAMTVLTVALAVLVTHRSLPVAAPAAAAADPDPEPGEDGEYVRRETPVAAFLDEQGALFPLHRETAQGAHLLVFLSPGCGTCHQVAPLVSAWVQELAPTVRVRAVVVGTPEYREAHLPGLSGPAWYDPYGVARRAFAVGTPGAVLVGADGKLAGGPVAGEADVLDFVAEVREHLRGAVAVSDAP